MTTALTLALFALAAATAISLADSALRLRDAHRLLFRECEHG